MIERKYVGSNWCRSIRQIVGTGKAEADIEITVPLFVHHVDLANRKRCGMPNDTLQLDQMRSAYQAAVEEWISAIKREEALASVDHSIAEVDEWEQAHFKEDEIRSKVKAAKKQYEDALRVKFFNF